MQQTVSQLLEHQNLVGALESLENLLWLIAGLIAILVVTQIYRIRLDSRSAVRPEDDWSRRVEDAYNKGDYDEALEILDCTELIFPSSAWVEYWRGRCFFQMERWQDAADTFEGLLRKEPIFRQSVKDYLVFIELNELAKGIEGYIDSDSKNG